MRCFVAFLARMGLDEGPIRLMEKGGRTDRRPAPAALLRRASEGTSLDGLDEGPIRLMESGERTERRSAPVALLRRASHLPLAQGRARTGPRPAALALHLDSRSAFQAKVTVPAVHRAFRRRRRLGSAPSFLCCSAKLCLK
jgi:hypothetical protein